MNHRCINLTRYNEIQIQNPAPVKHLSNVIVNSIEKYRLEQEHDKLKEETEIKAQAALKYAQDLSDKLLLATKTAGIGIWDYSFDNNFFVADEVLLKHYNLTPAEFKGDYLELMHYVHPDDQTIVLGNFRQAFIDHSVVNTEFRITWQDGSTHFVKAVAFVQRDEVGNPARLIGTHQDVTVDKESEQVLRESEHRLVEAQSVTKVGSWETDLTNLKVIWSLETCRIFEIAPEESNTSHQNFLTFVHPDDRDEVDAAFVASLSLHTVNTIEHRIVTSSGTIKTVEERWRMISDDKGRPICTRGTIQDITERKQAQRLIIESEAKVVATLDELQQTLNDLNNIMDSSIDIICTIDEEGKFRKVSAASERILGYKPEELKGKKFIDFVFYQDVEMTIGVAEQISSGAPVTMFENRYVQKNGNVVPILWSARWDDNDNLMYCIAKDASEKKRLGKAFEEERKRFLELFVQAPFAMGILKGPDYIIEMANHHYLKLIHSKDVLGKSFSEARPELVEQGFIDILDEVYRTGKTFIANEKLVRIDSNDNGKLIDSYLNLIYQAYRNNEGIIEGIFFFAVDTTEHVLSRRKIEESEKKYKQIVETTQDGIWMIDKNQCTIFVNKKLCEILGYTYEEMMGKKNTFFMDDEGKTLATKPVPKKRQILNDKVDIPLLTKGGVKVWVTLSGTIVLDEHGQYNGGLAMVTDITEIRAAGQSLKDSEKRFRQIVETAQEGIWRIDENNRTTFVNDKMCAILEYSREEMMGTSNLSFNNEEEMRKESGPIERRKKGMEETHESLYTTKSGKQIWVNVSTNPMLGSNGEYEGALAMITDITKRKAVEKKLAQSESSLKRAQALADMGNWEIDLADNRLIWSDELYKIFELNRGDVTPSRELFLSIVHPEDRHYVKQQMLKSSKYLTGVSFEYRLIKTDDSVKYCYTESRFEFDKDNKPVRLYGIIQDITIRKLAEIERTKMIKDIIQRNKELEQFTYIVSHNLRAPVANIIGFTEALSDQSFSQSLQKEFLSQLSVSVSKLDDVIRDLNNVLLVKQKVNDVKEQISLSTIVDNIKISIRNLLEQYEVTIETDFAEVESINSIKTFVHSILYNLISNSIKYRSPGKAPVISIRTHKTPERLEMVFSDNGLGIDMKKNHDKVFGLYKRFHLNIEGKGLGLFMTKSQIETLGGTIEVSSEINGGTTFKIYLPSSTIVL